MEFASAEVAMHWHHIEMQIDRIIETSREQSVALRNWQPPAANTNSVHVLAVHTIANIRQSILEVIAGEPTGRDRDAEFLSIADEGNNQADVWDQVKPELALRLASITDEHLSQVRRHPRRGERTVREILVFGSTHAAEHAGHCELTRDLARAAGI